MMENLKWFFIKKLLGKEENDMAIVYAYAILDGDRTIDQVPVRIRDKVKEVLIKWGFPELATEAGK